MRERVARWTWRDETVTSLDELRRLASEDLSSTVLRLHLDMAVSVAEEKEVDALTSLLKGNLATSGRAGAFILDRSRLRLQIGPVEDVMKDAPETLLIVAARLAQEAPQSDEAQRALQLLYRLVERGGAVRIVKLEVENFRGIRAASIPFESGLNVLHGPNDLGKSTLAEAIRAALLVPTKSKEGKSYVRWDDSAPARVTLTFESGGKLWRVRKTFGSGSQSVLERSDSLDPPDSTRSRKAMEWKARCGSCFAGALRRRAEKARRSKPTSYLVTALLGRQGEVQSILDASLADDKDDTGKALVTNALGVLGKDPLVARVVERLSERVDAIFTPGEKFKKTADSPLVRLQEHLKVQEDHLRDLRDADSKGKAIEERVVTLQSRAPAAARSRSKLRRPHGALRRSAKRGR